VPDPVSYTATLPIGKPTVALAAAAPGLHGAPLAARSAGHSHVSIDGTLIYAERSNAAGPTAKVDL
jgi:hypothetical protein